MSHQELRTFYPKMTLEVFWQGMLTSLEFTEISIRGPGWLSGCTLLSHKFKSAGSNSRKFNGFIHPGLPTSSTLPGHTRAPEVVGKVLPTTLQLHTAYLLRSLLIEIPDRWRKALFDPEAHTITARYLLFTDVSFIDSHATQGGGFFIMDRHTNTTYLGGSHLHPIFD